jgi:hypothetical protein
MIYAPRFVYNGAVELALTLSQKLWTYEEGSGMGGEDTSAAGVPESYIVRWDQLMNMTLRYTEAERGAVMEMLKWCVSNKGTAFSLFHDQTDVTGVAVYLESPKTSERIKSDRESGSPWVLTTTITLRSPTSVRFARNPYP